MCATRAALRRLRCGPYLESSCPSSRPTPPTGARASAPRAGAAALLGRRYGDFDAALIWNLHARHLAQPGHWRALYESGASGNAAYPFGLPALVALGWRMLGSFSPVVPFLIAVLPTVCIPVMVFLQA